MAMDELIKPSNGIGGGLASEKATFVVAWSTTVEQRELDCLARLFLAVKIDLSRMMMENTEIKPHRYIP